MGHLTLKNTVRTLVLLLITSIHLQLLICQSFVPNWRTIVMCRFIGEVGLFIKWFILHLDKKYIKPWIVAL